MTTGPATTCLLAQSILEKSRVLYCCRLVALLSFVISLLSEFTLGVELQFLPATVLSVDRVYAAFDAAREKIQICPRYS